MPQKDPDTDHAAEWACEAVGTALLILGGLSAIFFNFQTGSPVAGLVPGIPARLFVTGVMFGSVGGLVAVSPLGRRSGAHLNPAITLAFWITRHVDTRDFVAYVIAQCAGAVIGAEAARLLWRDTAVALSFGATHATVEWWDALALEAAMTAILVAVIMVALSHTRTMKVTPIAVALTVGVLVMAGAAQTGSSMNPARSLGPDVVADAWNGLWLYFVGPCCGAAAVAISVRTGPRRLVPVTAKLFHDRAYRTIFRDPRHL